MQFLDDLDLKSSIFLNKHYVVSHKTRTDSTKDSNCMNYFIKKRNPVSQAEKHWSFGLSIADSVTFDFNESVWIDLGPKLSEKNYEWVWQLQLNIVKLLSTFQLKNIYQSNYWSFSF